MDLRRIIREAISDERLRVSFENARQLYDNLENFLKKRVPGIKIMPVGSLRRGKETIRDIDMLVLSGNWNKILQSIGDFADQIKAKGNSLIRFDKDSTSYDILRLMPNMPLGAMLLHATGPAQYNLRLRYVAKLKGWKLSQYGLVDQNGKLLPSDTEENIQRMLNVKLRKPEER